MQQIDGLDAFISDNCCDLRTRDKFDRLRSLSTVDKLLSGRKFIAAVNDDHLAGGLAEQQSIFERRIAAAYVHDSFFVQLVFCSDPGFYNTAAIKLCFSRHP